jgi:hypothetical protein
MTKRKLNESCLVVLKSPNDKLNSNHTGFKSIEIRISREEFLIAETKLRSYKNLIFERTNNSDGEDKNETEVDTSIKQTSKKLKIPTEVEQKIDLLTKMTMPQLSEYNFEDIDEEDLFQRTRILSENKNTASLENKLKNGMIVWAEWSFKGIVIMWPSIFLSSDKSADKSNRVSIRYIEQGNRKNYIIKKSMSQIKGFFSERHFDYKVCFKFNFLKLIFSNILMLFVNYF